MNENPFASKEEKKQISHLLGELMDEHNQTPRQLEELMRLRGMRMRELETIEKTIAFKKKRFETMDRLLSLLNTVDRHMIEYRMTQKRDGEMAICRSLQITPEVYSERWRKSIRVLALALLEEDWRGLIGDKN